MKIFSNEEESLPKKQFTPEEIESIREQILHGATSKLRSRANKTATSSQQIPKELFVPRTPEILHLFQKIRELPLNLENRLFFLALSAVAQELQISVSSLKKILYSESSGSQKYSQKNRFLIAELLAWNTTLSPSLDHFPQEEWTLPQNSFNWLGAFYQGLLYTSEQGKGGIYYTTEKVVHQILQEYPSLQGKLFDPCCGTGAFLLVALQKMLLENQIPFPLQSLFGADIDPIAVRLTRLNLLLNCPEEKVSSPQVYCLDSLLPESSAYSHLFSQNNFDLVLSNPPWGASYSRAILKQYAKKFPDIRSQESFSFFLKRGIHSLKPGGHLSYLLPESILTVKNHADIRKFLSEEVSLQKIENLGQIFSGVFSSVIRLDLQKKLPACSHRIAISSDPTLQQNILQKRFCQPSEYLFNIYTSDAEELLLEKIQTFPHFTLKDQAEWAMGIVTGNNQKFISSFPQEDYEPLWRGRDIFKYSAVPPQMYLRFDPKALQQCASIQRYKAPEKLIYRFISRELVFSYDASQTLVLNSANILIPQSNLVDIKYILAVLNSSLSQYFFTKKFASLKVLRHHLEAIPIPLVSSSIQQEVIQMVNTILNPSSSQTLRQHTSERIDQVLLETLPLTASERERLSSKTFLSKYIV